jgi:glycosyltransferase involved in cell wall biosynthesis
MRQNPKISIIITAYNIERFIRASILSALNQTCVGSYEIIVIDDGSTDETGQILDSMARGSDKMRIIHQKNHGHANAVNRALKESKGKFIVHLDGDDLLANNALQACVNVLERHPEIGLVYTDNVEISEKNKFILKRKKIPYNPDELMHRHYIHHLRVFRKEVYEKVGGFNPKFKHAACYDWTLRVSEHFNMLYIPKLLYLYRIVKNSISHKPRTRQCQIQEAEACINEAFKRRGINMKAKYIKRDPFLGSIFKHQKIRNKKQ